MPFNHQTIMMLIRLSKKEGDSIQSLINRFGVDLVTEALNLPEWIVRTSSYERQRNSI